MTDLVAELRRRAQLAETEGTGHSDPYNGFCSVIGGSVSDGHPRSTSGGGHPSRRVTGPGHVLSARSFRFLHVLSGGKRFGELDRVRISPDPRQKGPCRVHRGSAESSAVRGSEGGDVSGRRSVERVLRPELEEPPAARARVAGDGISGSQDLRSGDQPEHGVVLGAAHRAVHPENQRPPGNGRPWRHHRTSARSSQGPYVRRGPNKVDRITGRGIDRPSSNGLDRHGEFQKGPVLEFDLHRSTISKYPPSDDWQLGDVDRLCRHELGERGGRR